MNKNFVKGLAVGIASVVLVETAGYTVVDKAAQGIGVYVGADNSALGKNTSVTLSKMNAVKRYIDQYFMTEVDESNVTEGIYKGMVAGLDDPYSDYYTKEEYRELMEENSGVYCGIGATVTQDPTTGSIYVVETIEGGAAREAGLQTGDEITKVKGKSVKGKDLSEVVSEMKGKEGTRVEVEVYLNKQKESKVYTMERREVEVPTVRYEMKEDQMGYVAVSAFEEPTDEQFIKAVEDLKKQGMKGMIIDLRNNGGGMLDSVVNMLDYMLPEGKTIVSVKDKNGEGEVYKAKDKREFTLPLVVLINEYTASASEVFSGAVKDYRLGSLVGTTSFGKGIVQSVMSLNDGSAIKLTTARYFTPDGTNIHKKGIKPDVEVTLEADSKKDTQYNEAVRLLKQKMKAESQENNR